MADLNELFKKASDKKSVPISPTKRSFGLKETMASIKSDPKIIKTDSIGEQTLGRREADVSQALAVQANGFSTDKSDQPLMKAGSAKLPDSEKTAKIRSEEANIESLDTNANDAFAQIVVKSIEPLAVIESKEKKQQPLGRREADVSQTLGKITFAKPISETIESSTKSIQEQLVVIPKVLTPASSSINGSIKPKHEDKFLNVDFLNSHSQDIPIAAREPIPISPTTADPSLALGSREAGIIKPLGRREIDVSQTLGELNAAVSQTLGKTKPTEQTLEKPLGRREIDASQTLGETLGSREAGVRLIEQLKTLVGNERELTEIVFFEAKKTGTHTTDAIKSDKLCSYFNMNSTTLRNLVDRVKKKNILTCASTVGGHSSVRIFNLSPVVYHHLMQQTLGGREVAVRWSLGEPLVSRETDVTQTLGLHPSKLVSKNNTNLLTTDRGGEESNQVTSFQSSVLNVQDIQIENLAKFNITRKQIQDIKNQRLAFTTESLQDFVDRFFIYASDSQNVRNIKSIPAIFVKMAQLASKGEDPLSDIETESDRLIRELLERKKQERERRLNLQEELLSFEFEDWLTQLDPEKQLALVPENAVARVGSGAHRMLLREYYKNHIWPDKFRELGV